MIYCTSVVSSTNKNDRYDIAEESVVQSGVKHHNPNLEMYP